MDLFLYLSPVRQTLFRAAVPGQVIPLGNCTVITKEPEQPDGTEAQLRDTVPPELPTVGVDTVGEPQAPVTDIAW